MVFHGTLCVHELKEWDPEESEITRERERERALYGNGASNFGSKVSTKGLTVVLLCAADEYLRRKVKADL